jgi:hypothetical protein
MARCRDVRAAVREETARRVEQAIGRLATLSVARMDDQLPWFRKLPADQRSWVTLVAQAGLQSFVDWLRSPDDILGLTGHVFASAPRELARAVTLQQTVELVRLTISVAEEQLPAAVEPDQEPALREELLRFSREIAFAAARVYAGAAESRGSWDARLEALVIDGLVRGSADTTVMAGGPLSEAAALGWHTSGPVAAVVGSAPSGSAQETLSEVHRLAHRMDADVMAGVHGGRLVVVVGGLTDPLTVASLLLPTFGPGPVVASAAVPDLASASTATQAALAGLRAAAAWPGAPRPVSAMALLPERALAGDAEAHAELIAAVYQPLAQAGEVLLGTVTAFLDAGGALEATARELFVHANTVRYRLRRVAEISGQSATDPRGSFTLRIALVLGRLDALG